MSDNLFAVDTGPLRDILKTYPVKNEKIIQASVKDGMRKVGAYLKKQALKEMKDETRLKLTLLRNRVKSFRYVNGKFTGAKVWFGLRPVSLKYLNPRQTKDGVKAGPFKVQGGFISKKLGGPVFKRRASDRLPIDRQSFDLKEAGLNTAKDVAFSDWQTVFNKEFERALRWRTTKEFLKS